jgi:thioredoxin reductase (NADPH)
MALMARAYNQAQKFGVEMAIPDEAIGLNTVNDAEHSRFALRLANGEHVSARSVVIATEARYRRLTLPGLDAIEGSSVHYWASPIEAKLCANQEVALVGAGNSRLSSILQARSPRFAFWFAVQVSVRACRVTLSSASGASPM